MLRRDWAGDCDKSIVSIKTSCEQIQKTVAAVIDVRASKDLASYQLALPINVVILGEISALSVAGTDKPDANSVAIVCAAFVAAAIALVLGVLAGSTNRRTRTPDQETKSRDEVKRRPLSIWLLSAGTDLAKQSTS